MIRATRGSGFRGGVSGGAGASEAWRSGSGPAGGAEAAVFSGKTSNGGGVGAGFSGRTGRVGGFRGGGRSALGRARCGRRLAGRAAGLRSTLACRDSGGGEPAHRHHGGGRPRRPDRQNRAQQLQIGALGRFAPGGAAPPPACGFSGGHARRRLGQLLACFSTSWPMRISSARITWLSFWRVSSLSGPTRDSASLIRVLGSSGFLGVRASPPRPPRTTGGSRGPSP